MFLAVSQTDDPTGSWWEYSVDVQGSSGTWMDYPAIGFNNNWIVVTGNMFTTNNNSFSATKILVFNKSSVTTGIAGTVTSFSDPGIFSLEPAVTYDANVDTEYMLTEWNNNSGGNCYVRIYTITGSAGSPVYTAGNTVGTNKPYSFTQKTAPQQGTTNKISTNDTRMRSVVYRNGNLYGAQTVFLPSSAPNRSSVQVWQIKTSNSTVANFFRVDDSNASTFYSCPSVSVNANSDVVVGYSLFSSGMYASSGYSYRTSSDPANTLESNYTYKSGQSTYYKTFGGGVNRWGDYSATSVDPVDGSLWTIQQFAYTPSNSWGTVWANVAASTGGSLCTETNEPNNTKNTATALSPGSDLSSQISTATDADWFSFSNTSGLPHIKAMLTTLPVNYDIRLYNAAGTKVASSLNSGTTSENLIYNNGAVGVYKLKVSGKNGTFSNTQCYTIHVDISNTPFKVEAGSPVAESQNPVKIYPNPNAGTMTLEYDSENGAPAEIHIFDVTGKMLVAYEPEIREGINTLHPDVSQLTNGVYFLEISEDGEISRVKLMIEK